jgi:hypothetical protein
VTGIIDPTKTFPSVLAAARAYGAAACDVEIAGQVDAVRQQQASDEQTINNLQSQVTALQNEPPGQPNLQEIGPVTSTGVSQTVSHSLGVTPRMVIPLVTQGPSGESPPAYCDYTAKDASTVTILCTAAGCQLRIYVFA